MKYRKKPVIVEAIQFNPEQKPWPGMIKPWPKIKDGMAYQPRDMSFGYIETLEGDHHVQAGDWIIKGVKGEFYPCKPDIFELTYEAIS